MDYVEYRKRVLTWRNSLIQAWVFSCQCTDSDCAYMLISMGRKLGLTDRDSLSGGVMKTWPKKQIAPNWACSSALVLLISNQYFPHKDEILAAMVFYWLTDNAVQSENDALASFPPYLLLEQGDRVRYWIESFFKK